MIGVFVILYVAFIPLFFFEVYKKSKYMVQNSYVPVGTDIVILIVAFVVSCLWLPFVVGIAMSEVVQFAISGGDFDR